VRRYVDEVRSGAFPAAEHSYKANGSGEAGQGNRDTAQGARVVNFR